MTVKVVAGVSLSRSRAGRKPISEIIFTAAGQKSSTFDPSARGRCWIAESRLSEARGVEPRPSCMSGLASSGRHHFARVILHSYRLDLGGQNVDSTEDVHRTLTPTARKSPSRFSSDAGCHCSVNKRPSFANRNRESASPVTLARSALWSSKGIMTIRSHNQVAERHTLKSSLVLKQLFKPLI